MAKEENLHIIENDSLLNTFEPTDYSDVGQGQLLARAYKHRLCFCEGIGWFTYKDGIWVPSDIDAHGYSQKLTGLQLQEAAAQRYTRYQNGVSTSEGDKYLDYARSRRTTARIAATLKEAMPMLCIETAVLDGNPLILNTPSGEVDLQTGELLPHNPGHYITHMTATSPSDEGSEIWNTFLLQVACGDVTVAEFLQQIAGMAAIGKVYEERLVIAVGSG